MTTPEEKRRRKAVAWSEQKRRYWAAKAARPLSHDQFNALIDHICESLSHGPGVFENCDIADHGFASSRDFLAKKNLPVDDVIAWLQSVGGTCDCQVLYSVADEGGPFDDSQDSFYS